MSAGRWQFWIDRGGTFTDCLGLDPESGLLSCVKVLSSDQAPLKGMRKLLGLAEDEPIPPSDIRMGTTLATNALLERRGTPTALIISKGFADALEIGNQTRSAIFDLDIVKPEQLYRQVIETSARMDASGQVVARPDIDYLRVELEAARQAGIESVAVVVLHAHLGGQLEEEIADVVRSAGIEQVALSSQIAAEQGLVGRGDTTVVDAYLTPILAGYLASLADALPGSTLHVMQSSGDLALASFFRGKNAVLSGPAGGVVACGRVARDAGYDSAIGFDMGGTSTDVSCWDRVPDRVYETEVAGVRLRAPMMEVHTVAAGGGSICRFQGFRFTVGPHSAGALPGPLCYGHPDAKELTITDVNLCLGRVIDDRFPFELDRERSQRALQAMTDAARAAGHDTCPERIAIGLRDIANANMAEAIRKVSVAKGRDVRDYALVVFGGAGGQHGCAVARHLGIRTLIFDEHAGVLSALGMGLAEVAWHGERDAGRVELSEAHLSGLEDAFVELVEHGRTALQADGHEIGVLNVRRQLDLRYAGTESPLTIAVDGRDAEALRRTFEDEHQRRFGYLRQQAAIEIAVVRVVVAAEGSAVERPAHGSQSEAAPRRMHRLVDGDGTSEVPVYYREDLAQGQRLRGPCLVLDATGTVVIERGFELAVDGTRLMARDCQPDIESGRSDTGVDPVRLEIFGNLFMSIATQMGAALRRTAVSTNIRDRLDFSCAIFDAGGDLVANAPHIPVHLGAMSESIRGVLARHPDPTPGSVFVTNDPRIGGSHLPDITVVTPVHAPGGELRFFSASRGHHADVGGTTPGSMPPDATGLDQEGVVLEAEVLVENGRFRERAIRELLQGGPYPARDPATNLADLRAQVAANRAGANLLEGLFGRFGEDVVLAYMQHVQDNAANEVAEAITRLPDGSRRFRDRMDDGTPVVVGIDKRGDGLFIDFAGTGPRNPGNLNAPRAVTMAAIIYVLRTMVGTPIPLNSGCLAKIDVAIPAGSLLDPGPESAVSAGNVETSQRIVDVLLAALGLAAASQGTMNNLTFGNQSFGYYETIAGGVGATPSGPGASGVHSHMTNTRITDAEILEARYPVRVRRFGLRAGSGGAGQHRGGDGVIRELELLEDMDVSLVTERRRTTPFGLAGGQSGLPGHNRLRRPGKEDEELPGRVHVRAEAGSILTIETPGGGGWGQPR